MCPSFHSIALVCVLIILNIIIPNFAENYNLILNSFKCTAVNNDYVANISCFTVKSDKTKSANLDLQLKKSITDLRVDFFIYKENVVLFKLEHMDGCEFLRKKETLPMIQIYKNMSLRPSNSVPSDCPIPKDFHFKVLNITLESSVLPTYVPEIAFKVVFLNKDKKTLIYQSELKGSVVRIKNNKSRKKP